MRSVPSSRLLRGGTDPRRSSCAASTSGFGRCTPTGPSLSRWPRGTVHGLIGENGAGKSTLMNIVYGYHRADAGEIRVRGGRVDIHCPHDAIAAGIGMVHQHFMLVDNLTVLENVVLGVEGGRRLAGGLARARAELEPHRAGARPGRAARRRGRSICRSACSSGWRSSRRSTAGRRS